MRPSTRTFPLLLVASSVLWLACSSSEYPNPILTFNMGQEDDTYDGVKRFEVERVDTDFKSERILRDSELPESIDMGDGANYYQYVGTGYDADDNRLAVGRTLYASAVNLLGSEVPMFFARTDRATRPDGNFVLEPMQNPVAAVLAGSLVWYMNGTDDQIKTDSYNVAYWGQADPLSQYQTIDCPKSPCNLKNLVIVGGIYALAIAEKWALFINAQESYASTYKVPDDLTSWGDVAGGRVIPGNKDTAMLAGPTRLEKPTTALVAFDSGTGAEVFHLNQARAGAALIAEELPGLVLSGGSSSGAGVERLDADTGKFVELPYPADPVVGAALVMEDETHLIRVGGTTSDGADAPTVRIDLECDADCAYVAVTGLDLSLRNALSFFDPVTQQTLVVGEHAETGVTQVYRYGQTKFTEITFPKAQQRVRALALRLPNQQLGLIGGTNPSNEEESRTAISVVAF